MTHEQFLKAASLWKERDAASVHLPEKELRPRIDRFLTGHRVLSLACAAGDFVRCTPLEYTWHDGCLWIFSEGGQKFLALEQNPHVGIAVYEQSPEFGALASLQIQGTAQIIEPFSDAYNREAEFRKIPLEVLRKLPTPMHLLCITPGEMTLLDSSLKQEGYGSRQSLVW